MSNTLLQLHPGPHQEVPLQGLYLQQKLHRLGNSGKPFVYANFLSSLDGRIALTNPLSGQSVTPKTLTTPSDFRLFLELHAQADCLITHGGYMRALSEKRLGNILNLNAHSEHADLVSWRQKNKLSKQPALVIASASLDFPIPKELESQKESIFIATGKNAPPERINAWQKKGFQVLIAGANKLVEGKPLTDQLSQRGYKSIYLIAGPMILHTMLEDRQLSRLYHTQSQQLLGGSDFHTLVSGKPFNNLLNLRLSTLYYEPANNHTTGQLFFQYNL
ncbi:MAG TPA: riboflavin biosynthesis protein RibD [Methylococcaceae bacterium]|jgi:riboflavin biosynthesis pyrimidine reductase|nr:riboflavin biosynthesis protein RibD [Methylococcaceae bacterium]HIN68322.1 riboflavin biosynthesis protein RibD [Methylococcales bacterium]HIA45214.1 riboflavin biosynthesis protein RibD [Methylococcaceae bacterium]HIB63029.1 riboflavin biosynthesis protein RibD [Methylococcaceae bacterium]HIO12142.1 riboflavin biosynthesis protein RibD [Methylococcales bacterium]